LLLAGAVVAASGCTMPRATSSLSDIKRSSAEGQIKLVPVTAQTVPPAAPPTFSMFPAQFIEAPEYPFDEVGPGDRLDVHVWESGTPTVFTSSSGNSGSDLGDVVVDESGNLYLPFAGSVHVAGMTLAQVRDAISRKLRTVVLSPQVDVRMVEGRSKLVSVQGTAAKTGSVPIEKGRTRLAALLAEVAPDQKAPEMLAVTLRRGGVASTVRLSDIYKNASLNVALQPGDSIILTPVLQSVTILGAAGVQGQLQIPTRDFNVMQAIGMAHGLSNEDADPRGVFLLRAQASPSAPPIVYQFDMRRPESVALASHFVLRDGDAILISNAPFAQIRSTLSAFATGLTAARTATLLTP
jgi:polysaccharide export outer membrane protein